MIGQFAVDRAVDISERGVFALVGEITEGRAKIGMEARLDGEEETFDALVHDVEFLGGSGGDAGGTELALTFSYSGPDERERWRAIDWTGKRLSLFWGG